MDSGGLSDRHANLYECSARSGQASRASATRVFVEPSIRMCAGTVGIATGALEDGYPLGMEEAPFGLQQETQAGVAPHKSRTDTT
jgi:hypothetical protein